MQAIISGLKQINAANFFPWNFSSVISIILLRKKKKKSYALNNNCEKQEILLNEWITNGK